MLQGNGWFQENYLSSYPQELVNLNGLGNREHLGRDYAFAELRHVGVSNTQFFFPNLFPLPPLPIPNLSNFFCLVQSNLLISQLSPKDPGEQVQLYPPGNLVHAPLLWHGELVQLSTTNESELKTIFSRTFVLYSKQQIIL